MSNIDKQALREKFETWAEQAGALPWGHLKKQRTASGNYSVQIYTYMWHAWSACNEALLDELEAAEHTAAVDHEAACSLVEENEEVKRKLVAAEQRVAELEAKLANPVLLPKTNGYWTEQEKAYEEAITLAKQRVRLAGFRCEGDE